MKMNHKIKLVQGLVFDDCDNCNPIAANIFALAVIDGESLLFLTALLSGDIPAIAGSALVLYFVGQEEKEELEYRWRR